MSQLVPLLLLEVIIPARTVAFACRFKRSSARFVIKDYSFVECVAIQFLPIITWCGVLRARGCSIMTISGNG